MSLFHSPTALSAIPHLSIADKAAVSRHIAWLAGEPCALSLNVSLPDFGSAEVCRDGRVLFV